MLPALSTKYYCLQNVRDHLVIPIAGVFYLRSSCSVIVHRLLLIGRLSPLLDANEAPIC